MTIIKVTEFSKLFFSEFSEFYIKKDNGPFQTNPFKETFSKQPLQTMACSKLFSGDLPELSTYIIQDLRNNFNTLYSLALVNRFWCRLAIPLLWEDPFSIKYRKNSTFHFLDIYFLFLNENDKSKLKEIKFYGFEHKPLFNYPSLIKTLKIFRVQLHVTNWLNHTSYNVASTASATSVQQSSNGRPCLPTCLQNKLIETMTHCVDYEKIKDTCVALFNLFIENNASLNGLYVNNLERRLFNDICKYCNINSSTFISEIEFFSFYYYSNLQLSNSVQTFLSSLLSLSTSIKHIDFSSNKTESNNLCANIIKSQSQLCSIKFSFPEILNSLRHSSNTLTSINFYSCQFSNTMRFDALSYLTQLESLRFSSCHGLNSNVIQPLLNITSPLKIKTLVILDNRFARLNTEVFTPIQLLLMKIGVYIENLVLSICEDELRRKLFDIIIDSCEKIKFLHLNNIDVMNIPQLSKMFFNFNNYLKYLTLGVKFNGYEIYDTSDNSNGLKISSMMLKELSKSLPLSLHYLDLNLIINPDDLQIAFENCKQVEIKKLLIKNWSKNNVDTTLKVIKDFVKEKELEFLAYCIAYNYLDDACCKSLEKLVKETQSFVKMMTYDDLAIKISEMDGNLIIS